MARPSEPPIENVAENVLDLIYAGTALHEIPKRVESPSMEALLRRLDRHQQHEVVLVLKERLARLRMG